MLQLERQPWVCLRSNINQQMRYSLYLIIRTINLFLTNRVAVLNTSYELVIVLMAVNLEKIVINICNN